jgi:hypothetical protein
MERSEYETELSGLRAALDVETFDAGWTEGRSLTADEAVALALS